MKTISIYELLGMIKDGKAPKKVIYDGNLWEFNKDFNQYQTKKDGGNIWNGYNFNILNDEVEILEEEPYVEVCGSWFTKSEYDEFVKGEEEKEIPEKLPFEGGKISDNEFLAKYISHNRKAINEIIDYLDYLKSKGE